MLGGGRDFITGGEGSLGPEQIVWSEQAFPRVLRTTSLTDADAPTSSAIDIADHGDIFRAADSGREHVRWPSHGVHDLVVDRSSEARINAISLPLDDAFELRLDAARRFWRELKGKRPAPAYGALPQQAKGRQILNLRAFDGRQSGAPQRQIAETLFTHTTVSSRDWRDHPLRHRVRAILRRADRLVVGGYRDLLFYPGTAPL
ncbi:MAG: DUF2285 domain-containing protein [Rhizobiaceae bacterium]|nr:DUF2285 domain-containing protein [Rhizobiaceae bacterium]